MQILLKFYMHIKATTLHFFYAKKFKIVQNQEKSLWCILKRTLSNWSMDRNSTLFCHTKHPQYFFSKSDWQADKPDWILLDDILVMVRLMLLSDITGCDCMYLESSTWAAGCCSCCIWNLLLVSSKLMWVSALYVSFGFSYHRPSLFFTAINGHYLLPCSAGKRLCQLMPCILLMAAHMELLVEITWSRIHCRTWVCWVHKSGILQPWCLRLACS